MIQKCFNALFSRQKGWINKLNGRWTPVVLVTLSVVSFICRYIDDPVSCWCPAEFGQSMVEYTNRFCWRTHNVYLTEFEDYIPKIPMHYRDNGFAEKQAWCRWIPLILLFQAILFKIPAIIMHFGESKLGFKERKLRGLSAGYNTLSLEDRAKLGKQLGSYLNQWLKSKFLSGLPFGELTITIIFVYLLYLANVTVQIVLIDKLMKDPKVKTYGTHLAHNLFGNRSIQFFDSPAFVKVFLCDFKIRKLAMVQQYTVQCINNINLVSEQIYAFLWVWLSVTAIISFCGCAMKTFQILIPCFRKSYVKQYLLSGNIVIRNENDVSRFANSILGEDGVMVLKGISDVSSEFLVRDAIMSLWILNFGDGSNIQQHHVGNVQTFVQQPVHFQNVRPPTNMPQYSPLVNASSCSSRDDSVPPGQMPGKDKTC